MNDLPVARQSMAVQSSSAPAEGFLGGMDLSTISALVVLASAFMRR